MKPSIFLSHSCRDREVIPPADVPAAEHRARAERLEFARRFRRTLDERLRATGRYQVWLDQRSLRGGDLWRDGIHRALRHCSGAVLLLSPEALESRWVLKETTILTWRALLGEAVCVVPVLLGVAKTDLATAGYEPVGISDFQIEEVRVAADVDEVVERIVGRFAERIPDEAAARPSTWSSTVEQWLVETARLLHEDDERYARMMFGILGLDFDAEDRFGERSAAVAHELLVSGTDSILDVLHTLSGVRTPDQKTLLRQAVEALWVDANAANRLPFVAARKRPPRVAAIDADEPVTGREYVRRAYCGKLRPDRVFAPDDHTDGSLEQSLARLEDLLADSLPLEDPVRLAADIERNGPVYVVVGPGAVSTGVVGALTDRYPALTVVALTGGDTTRTDDVPLPRGTTRLAPPLRGRERDGRRYRKRLGAFA
jgi:hypothetical protein